MKEESINRKRGSRNNGNGDHRCQRVAGGVKGARVESLRGPEYERKREPEEVNRTRLRVSKRPPATAVDEIDQGNGGHHHPARREQCRGRHAVDGVVDSIGKFL